ncbi:MAG: hypothetical protein AAFX81_06570 [Pseudomonadota bacterium]
MNGRSRRRLAAVAGLLALAAASDVHASEDPVLRQLQCTGNEPFWSAAVNRTTALVSWLGAAGREEAVFQGRLDDLTWLPPGWAVFAGDESEGAGRFVLTTRNEHCLDSMADGPPFDRLAVAVLVDGTIGTGCCRTTVSLDVEAAPLADAQAKPVGDWSRYWPELASGIDRCVRTSPLGVEAVTLAWPMNHGRMGARLLAADGQRADCMVDLVSGAPERFDTIGGDDVMPGENEPRFLPARDALPVLGCGRVERVVDGDGHAAGWLHYGGPCS